MTPPSPSPPPSQNQPDPMGQGQIQSGPGNLHRNLQANQAAALGQSLEAQGRVVEALAIYEDLVKKHPEQPNLHFAIGLARSKLGDTVTGRKLIEKAIRMTPRPPAEYYCGLATTCLSLNDFEASERAITRALSIDPKHPNAVRIRGDLFRALGKHEEAAEALRPIIESGEAIAPAINTYAKVLNHLGRREEALRVIEPLAADDSDEPAFRGSACFTLGLIHDKLKNYDEAFAAYERGNKLRAASASKLYDPDQNAREFDLMIEAWSPERFERLPRSRVTSEVPVFVLGMPRSGTTLVESIIARHPRAFGGGEMKVMQTAWKDLFPKYRGVGELGARLDELKPASIERVARKTLREFTSLDRKALRVTDKLPHNFLRVPLLRLMFPGCRIIHCQRHPLDTIVSNFAQDFQGPAQQAFSHDLAHAGRYYRDYHRLMQHFASLLPGEMLEVRYEDMTGDQEGQSKRLLDFLGLEWDDAVLEFHKAERGVVTQSVEQVRQPMYRSSVHRFRNYERHLGPAIEALGNLLDEGAATRA